MGDTLSLDLPCVLVFDCAVRPHYVAVMQACVADFVDSCFHRLELAHPVTDDDLFICIVIIALCTAFDFPEADGDR